MFYNNELIAYKLKRWEKVISNFRLPDWNTIPDIGLYMEQVIVLLSQYLELISSFDDKSTKDEESKVFTAAAINNYVRLKIMPAPIKKKYYRVHIAYLIMIFTLKQSISINVLREIIPAEMSSDEVEKTYNGYCQTYHKVSLKYVDIVRTNATEVINGDNGDSSVIENFFINEALISGFSRILTEKIVYLKGADKEETLKNEVPR